MRFAIPCDGTHVAEQFGKASHFAFYDANPSSGHILREEIADVPRQRGNVLPQWVADYGTDVVLATRLSGGERQRLADRGVAVVIGARGDDPRGLVEGFLADSLAFGPNPNAVTGGT